MEPPSLSGVMPERAIALAPGQPLLPVAETNRLLLRHGLNRALARAVVQEAVAAVVALTAAEEQALSIALLEQQGLTSPAERQAWLLERGWQLEDLRAIAGLAERLRRWSHWRFEAEVEVRFLDRKPDLDRVVYSLLRVAERELAEELHLRLLEQAASFWDLAVAFGSGAETETGGLVGPVPLSAAHPQLASRLRAGREGQLWRPFAIGEHWLVVRLERLLPARLDDGTRERLVHELFERWLDAQVEGLLSGVPLAPVPRPGGSREP